MLSTGSWALLVAIVSLCVALWGVFAAGKALLLVRTQNKRSVALAKLAELETELTSQADSLQSIMKTLKTIRSRVTMRERRAAAADEKTPDLTTETGRTIARAELEAELAKSGRLNPRVHLNGR